MTTRQMPCACRCMVFDQLRALEQGDWPQLDMLQTPDPRCENIVREWAQYYLERPIRSLRLLD